MMTVDAVGGVWRYAVDLAHALQRVGTECLLVGLGPAPSEIQRRECDARGIALTWTDEPLDWMEEEAALDGTGDALVALAREWGADVLHLNAASQAAGMPCALPVVVTSHSCVATWWAAVKGTPLPPGWRWQQALTARGLARADAVMVPTASHGRAIADVYGAGVRRHIVANATDDAEASGERRACVLAAGRWWDAAKNVRTLDAAAAVSCWPILLAGPLRGPNGESVALHHARSLGEVSAGAVRELMASAAIFVSSAVYEPFGLAVLEAAATGAALVLSDIPTFRELWHDAALFAPPDDARAFTAAIERLTDDAALRHSLGARARDRAREFPFQRQVDQVQHVYEIARQHAAAPVG